MEFSSPFNSPVKSPCGKLESTPILFPGNSADPWGSHFGPNNFESVAILGHSRRANFLRLRSNKLESEAVLGHSRQANFPHFFFIEGFVPKLFSNQSKRKTVLRNCDPIEVYRWIRSILNTETILRNS
jgi:hypothetical protein